MNGVYIWSIHLYECGCCSPSLGIGIETLLCLRESWPGRARQQKNAWRFTIIKSGWATLLFFWFYSIYVCLCFASVVTETRSSVVLLRRCSHLASVMDKCIHAIKATSVLLFALIKLIFFQLKMWLLHSPCLFLSSSHLIWCCKCLWLGSSSSK